MSILRKREGDNQEILEVEEILKNRGYSISLAVGRKNCSRRNTSKDHIRVSLTAFQVKKYISCYGLNNLPVPLPITSVQKNRLGRKDGAVATIQPVAARGVQESVKD